MNMNKNIKNCLDIDIGFTSVRLFIIVLLLLSSGDDCCARVSNQILTFYSICVQRFGACDSIELHLHGPSAQAVMHEDTENREMNILFCFRPFSLSLCCFSRMDQKHVQRRQT